MGKGLMVSEPFLYTDPNTNQEIHLLDRLCPGYVYLFGGSKNRPLVHIVSKDAPKADPGVIEAYRKSKLAQGWTADVVDKHVQRVLNPAKYAMDTTGSGSVLTATAAGGKSTLANLLTGGYTPTVARDDPWGGTITKDYWLVRSSNFMAKFMINLAFGEKAASWAKSTVGFVDAGYKGSYAGYLTVDSSSAGDQCPWLVPVPATRTSSGVIINGGAPGSYIAADCMLSYSASLSPVPGTMRAWKILDSAPLLFRGLNIVCSPTISSKGFSWSANAIATVQSDKWEAVKAYIAANPSDDGTNILAMVSNSIVASASAAGLVNGIPANGYLLTMPNGLSRYKLAVSSTKPGTVLGVDGVLFTRVWEECVITFDQLASLIESQIPYASEADKANLSNRLASLREHPDGTVNLVQYLAEIPMPYDPLTRLAVEKLAQRGGKSISGEKMSDDVSSTVTWGAANKRVNDLGKSSYFLTINDSVIKSIGGEVKPWYGDTVNNGLLFSTSKSGISCSVCRKDGNPVGGLDPLTVDEALTYSQLGYPFFYDSAIQATDNPKATVLNKFFVGYSEDDLVVPDPSTGKAINVNEILGETLSIDSVLKDGSLFFDEVSLAKRDVVSLLNKGLTEASDTRALLQQLPSAVFGAIVSDSSIYPNLDG